MLPTKYVPIGNLYKRGYLVLASKQALGACPKPDNDNPRGFKNELSPMVQHGKSMFDMFKPSTYHLVTWENPDQSGQWCTGLLQQSWFSGAVLDGAPRGVKLWLAATHDNYLVAFSAGESLALNHTREALVDKIAKDRQPVADSHETLPFIPAYRQQSQQLRPKIQP